MKKALFTFLQFLLFLIVFAVGSFLHPFNLHWASTESTVEQASTTNGAVTTIVRSHTMHYFVPDGLLLALGVFLAIIILQAIRKRLCNTTWTVVAFLLAVAVGYALRLGFVTQDLF